MSLSGLIICENVFEDPNAAQNFPATLSIVQQTMTALKESLAAHCTYASVLNSVGVLRRKYRMWSPEDTRTLLQNDPTIVLVRGLKAPGVGWLWGCVALQDADRAKYGEGICLNGDIALAMESDTTDPFLRDVCRTMFSVTVIRGMMHLLNHHAFPDKRLEPTPFAFGHGNLGLELEDLLLDGHIAITWTSQPDIGDLSAVERVTVVQRPINNEYKEVQLLGHHLTEYLESIANGQFLSVASFEDAQPVKPPKLPMVRDRGWVLRRSTGILLEPGQVSNGAGCGRLFTYEDQQAVIAREAARAAEEEWDS
ncbi:hypothetical protein FB45DRAFT_138692 [Roridomyces roridus]|uniref:Uncharacterized protein n=1 Tax=Roridomyces roridus TaxID=1738132 RepID=A0AAD7BHH4_9AGAR|nr:hypothetical protein FB45DRAFT_138692 [Roridomyces roridus]